MVRYGQLKMKKLYFDILKWIKEPDDIPMEINWQKKVIILGQIFFLDILIGVIFIGLTYLIDIHILKINEDLLDINPLILFLFAVLVMPILEEILFRISHAILVIINTLRVFFLVVLYIAGPLVIAISVFPGFEAAYMKWLSRYLSVHLWLGIGNVFEAIAVRLWRIIVESGGFWTKGLGLEDTVNSVILTQWAWMFLLILIVGYITVPIVAGWVISGAGIGQMGALLSASIGKGALGTGGADIKGAQRARYNPNK